MAPVDMQEEQHQILISTPQEEPSAQVTAPLQQFAPIPTHGIHYRESKKSLYSFEAKNILLQLGTKLAVILCQEKFCRREQRVLLDLCLIYWTMKNGGNS
jgi:hypothetical protein